MMFLRTIYESGGKMLRLSSVRIKSNLLPVSSALPFMVEKTNLCWFSEEIRGDDKRNSSSMRIKQEAPRNAYVKKDVIARISDLSYRYLRDEESFPGTVAMGLYTKEMFSDYFALLFERSKAPLMGELKDKLKSAGITDLQFSQSISKVLFTLKCEPDSNIVFYDKLYERDEIIRIFDHMKLNEVEYQCVKILLSLKENEFIKSTLWDI